MVYFVNHNFTKSQKHFAVTDVIPTFASWRISELISIIVDKASPLQISHLAFRWGVFLRTKKQERPLPLPLHLLQFNHLCHLRKVRLNQSLHLVDVVFVEDYLTLKKRNLPLLLRNLDEIPCYLWNRTIINPSHQ